MTALSCIDCGDDYVSHAPRNPSPRCAYCRANRRRETNREAKQRSAIGAPRVVRGYQTSARDQRRNPDYTELAALELGLVYHGEDREGRGRIITRALELQAAQVSA